MRLSKIMDESKCQKIPAEGAYGPLVDYVNSLLTDMCRKNMPIVELRRSMPLPTLNGEFGSPPEDFFRVVNRLKIMCDLTPMIYQQPADGKFRIRALGKTFRVDAHFDDKVEDPSVRLKGEEVESHNKQQKAPEELVP